MSKHQAREQLVFHLINGNWHFQLFLFLIHLAGAFCVLIGYKTRIATVLTWVRSSLAKEALTLFSPF